jgi:hypothetical protein
LVADSLVLATSEDGFQLSIYSSNTSATKYNMEISIEKTKIIAFQGKEPIPGKIFIDNRLLERVDNSLILVIHCHIKEK